MFHRFKATSSATKVSIDSSSILLDKPTIRIPLQVSKVQVSPTEVQPSCQGKCYYYTSIVTASLSCQIFVGFLILTTSNEVEFLFQ